MADNVTYTGDLLHYVLDDLFDNLTVVLLSCPPHNVLPLPGTCHLWRWWGLSGSKAHHVPAAEEVGHWLRLTTVAVD